MIARSSGAGLLLVFLAGCGVQNLNWNYICDDPDPKHRGPDGEFDPCHEQDVKSGDLGCDVGEFVHWQHGWESPSWLWIGPEDQAPECPLGSVTISYEGHADLVAPTICEACTCEPPTGSCALPSTLTASTTACSMPGGSSTSFNAPAPWNGTCDSTTQTPSGAAHSLTIDPIAMTENGCAPGPPVAAKVVSLRWDTYARACDVHWTLGRPERSICLPPDPAPPGFALCIFQNGENPCPTAPDNIFTEQHVFYTGVQDDRQCSACICGAPTGSACTAVLSIYKGNDLTCGGSPVTPGITISSAGPTCLDIQLPGQALGSKSAGPTTYLPGICPAIGGDGSGNAIPTHPATLCCRP
jgi:hypothetical protein